MLWAFLWAENLPLLHYTGIMENTRTHVILPGELLAAIDGLVGKRGRSSFLAEAAWHEIKRQRLLKLLQRSEPIWKPEDHPELQEGAAAWVERMRSEDQTRDRERTEP